ncbi:MAG TPA: hypothetical protein VLM92_11475, partial [Romboutsia sp.]|nr:hypothetical protein [Romboutsia sp.]
MFSVSYKNIYFFTGLIFALILSSCEKSPMLKYAENNPTRPFYEPSPYGMAYVGRGSFVIGQDD